MKKYIYILFILSTVGLTAQTALYNKGNIRIHENGNLGFHTHFINESPFDENKGLTGFYGPQQLVVSGTVVPLFFDTEIAVDNGLVLELGMGNANNTNFILGDIITARNLSHIYYNFLENGFYTGEGDFTKINGHTALTNQQNFIFPIGDSEQLRPLIINSQNINLFAQCAYFLENPNSPVSIPESFNTDQLDRDLEFVSGLEFWRLEGNVPATISLNWNERSDMAALTDDATRIVPVGWSKTENQWVNLGAGANLGTLEQGFVTSEAIIPDNYEIITLGVSKIPLEPLDTGLLSLENYFVSPNGDGINDSFFIPELLESPNNLVQIYDRYGLKVFEKSNYTDEFTGISNVDNFVITREDGLPVGVYFYIIYAADLDLNYQGFLYLAK
ncbi:gliding motility-associated C-terminal domain-containing protein [Maribacter sp. 2304DJ31-5]|uniref:gliding motility-associated C-terminal domain-containing protein n=1 Tax=Maribacter sp. 2304DJ31-5 TaxID=3386273 RepID=UPI0039BC4023